MLAYNCPGGCPDVVASLEALRSSQAAQGNGVPRVLITPDPLLPQRVAAGVWGWSYSGDSVDTGAIRCLLTHQDEEAPEARLGCAN